MNDNGVTIEQIEAELAATRPEPAPLTPYDDPSATWVYWTGLDSIEQGIPTDWVFERLRNRRNALLTACDFRVVTDAPWDVAPWLAYRQALRDLTKTPDPRQAMWPTPPEA